MCFEKYIGPIYINQEENIIHHCLAVLCISETLANIIFSVPF